MLATSSRDDASVLIHAAAWELATLHVFVLLTNSLVGGRGTEPPKAANKISAPASSTAPTAAATMPAAPALAAIGLLAFRSMVRHALAWTHTLLCVQANA